MRIGVLIVVLGITRAAFGQTETFDVATFVPPSGWQRTQSSGLVSFQDSGVRGGQFSSCQIFVFASRPSNASPEANFQAEWYARIAQPLQTTALPTPQAERTADGWTNVLGHVDLPQNGLPYRTILFTSTGAGRVISIVVRYTINGYESEITGFFNSLHMGRLAATQNAAPAARPAPSNAAPSGKIPDYVFAVPDGWARQNAPDGIVLVSPVYPGGERCQLSLLAMRPVARGLPDDALNIFRELFRAEPLTGDIYPPTKLFRGMSPQGWEYFMVKKPIGPSGGTQFGAIVLVARVGNNLAAIAGMSKEFLVSNCFGESIRDVWPPFFYSLQFKTATPSPQEQAAIRQRLAGAWITATASVGLRYEFSANGRYADAAAAMQRTRSADIQQTFFGNGSYSFDGNTLVMTGDDKRRTTAQFRLEQESKDHGRSWVDSLCLWSPGASGEVCYTRTQ